MFVFTPLISLFNNVFGNYYVLLLVETFSFVLKIFFLGFLFKEIQKSFILRRALFFLLISIFCSMITNISWILRLTSLTAGITIPWLPILLKIAWATYILYYQALTIFLEALIKKNRALNLLHILLAVISLSLASGVIYLTFLGTAYDLTWLSGYIIQYIYLMMPLSLLLIVFEIHKKNIPFILKSQIKIVIFAIIIPELVFDFLQVYPLNQLVHAIATNNFSMIGLSTSLSVFLMYVCFKKILKLRFLNLRPHVEKESLSDNFIETFSDVLEQLSVATATEELVYITKLFFEKAFFIPSARLKLILKTDNFEGFRDSTQLKNILEKAEKSGVLAKNKLLIFHDAEFDNFYENDENTSITLNLLKELNADLFAPVYQKNNILGYIIIESSSKNDTLFSKSDTNQIILFLNYLSNVINFINNRNFTVLIKNEKEIKDELYNKHREISQYKESLRYFLKNSSKNKLGIIFYRNRKFVFGNKDAEEMMPYNLNLEGHIRVKKIKQLVKTIHGSNMVQSSLLNDSDDYKIKVTGIPMAESNSIILVLTYPDVSDVIKDQIDILKNPSNWDYLLYLETTEAGRLINKLIPGYTEAILNFKVDLLKIALSKKAILLQNSEGDLDTIANIIHNVGLKEVMHVVDLKSPEKNSEVAIKLFGINPIFAQNYDDGLLKRLDNVGTILIKNIQFLARDSQEQLAEYLRYGFFNIYKSDQKVASNVRIICSTNSNLQLLTQENSFSRELYNELSETVIKMPSLISLDEKEVECLTDTLTDSAVKEDNLKEFLEFSDKERSKLIENRPASLAEFKKKIESAIIQKSKKINIYEKTEIDPEFNLSDPVLFKAARLGKNALRDPEVLSDLWGKFKNQNKIATFLGVNRSSVSRRLKDYKINIE